MALKKRDRTTKAIAAIEKARELYQRQGEKEGTQRTESLLRGQKKSSTSWHSSSFNELSGHTLEHALSAAT